MCIGEKQRRNLKEQIERQQRKIADIGCDDESRVSERDASCSPIEVLFNGGCFDGCG